MKILFVNPKFPDTFWGLRNALKFISKKATLPPLGLLTVAGMLPGDWEKKLVDMNISRLRKRDILWADYVFLSAMAIQDESVRQVISVCKGLGIKIVVGGPLFTSQPENYMDVDHFVLKEGELTVPKFIEDAIKGTPEKFYNTHEKADLSKTPVPLWDLINMKKYASMSIQYSRGCPFDCDFCDVTKLFGHKLRTKTPGQIVGELEDLYRRRWRGNVFFVDDNFIGNKAVLKRELLPVITDWMKSRDYPFVFNTQASINLADDKELMDAMVQAGFDCVFVGIETPDESCLSECNKVQNKGRDLIECVRIIQQSGLQVQAGFILGFDNDSESVFDNLIQFIQSSGVVMAMVGLLNAPRGTKLFKRLSEEHRIIRYATGDNTDCSINFHPRMGLEKLLAGYQKVLKDIYSQKNYSQRILTFLKNYNISAKKKVDMQVPKFRALLKSMLHIGILSRGRRHYWRLMLWSAMRPRYLQLAVTYSIYGYHFRKIFKRFDRRIECMVNSSDG